MDFTSLSELEQFQVVFYSFFFFLYIVVILKHFSLCFVFDICYRLTSGDLYLVGEVGGCLFVFLRGGQG